MDQIRRELINKAMKLGAEAAIDFDIDDIVFDGRTILKCLFGCEGGLHYCPTKENPEITKLYSDMAKKYKWGILIQTDNLKDGQIISIELERTAFLKGYYFALAATECTVCIECSAVHNDKCRSPKDQRLPLYAFGIDVYKTVRTKGWELEVVQQQGDDRKNITAVFVE